MGWFNNRVMRGASNRSNQRLAAEFGVGPATAVLALAMGHACYPTAVYGDNALQDDIVQRLKRFSPRPCDSKRACELVEAWLDKGTLSTTAVSTSVWGLDPNEFLERFFEQFQAEDGS
jgi:hypothetical protein